MILGPIVGGFLASKCGVATLYFVDLLSFCIALYGIVCLPSIAPRENISKRGWAVVKDGWQFIKGAPILLGALYVDFALTFWGMPNALFPAINEEFFGGNRDQLGLMLAAPALGGLITMVLSGRLNHLKSPPRMMIILCCLWAFSVMGFALSSFFTFSLLLLFIMGGLDSMVAILRSTIIQKVTPDSFRARVCAFEYIVSNIGPQLGSVRAGLLTVILTPQLAAIMSGLSSLMLAFLTFVIFPTFINCSTECCQVKNDREKGT